jgi:hypothetical protein
MFDPYHKWLGIPRDQRPPTYYQLLGVMPEENDREVIEEAALRQTAYLRQYQSGPHARDCARLLTEISQARLTLLNPAKRQAYDARLGNTTIKKASDETRVTARPTAVASPAEANDWAALAASEPLPPASRTRLESASVPGKSKKRWVILGGAGLVLIFLLPLLLFSGSGKDRKAVANAGPSDTRRTTTADTRPKPPTYLSDLNELRVSVGWDVFGRGALGPAMTRENQNSSVVSVKGKTYPHTLVMHPPASGAAFVTYQLGRKYKTFAATAAMMKHPSGGAAASAVTFRVLGDGKELWKSAPLQEGDATQACSAGVAEVNELELRAECHGESARAWAMWLDPNVK